MAGLVTTMVGGIPLTVREGTPDLRVARSCLVEGEFDLVAQVIPGLRSGLILDAGGYIGTAAIALARMFPTARIVSIEASSANFDILRRNVAPFPNIRAINKALVGRERKVNIRNRGTGEWGFTTIEQPRDNADAALMEEMEGVTVAGILREEGATAIDVFKLDIEGGEIDVLETSDEWLPATGLLVAELHERIIRGCKRAFERATAGRRTIRMGKEKIASLADWAVMPAEPAVEA